MNRTVQDLVRLAIIEEAQNHEYACQSSLREGNLNEAAALSNKASGLRMAAEIVKEWKPNEKDQARRDSGVAMDAVVRNSGVVK